MKKFDNQGPSTALKLNPNSAEPIDCAPPCRCRSSRIPVKNKINFLTKFIYFPANCLKEFKLKKNVVTITKSSPIGFNTSISLVTRVEGK